MKPTTQLSIDDAELLEACSHISVYGGAVSFVEDPTSEVLEISPQITAAKLFVDFTLLLSELSGRYEGDLDCTADDIIIPMAYLLAKVEAGDTSFLQKGDTIAESFVRMLNWIEEGGNYDESDEIAQHEDGEKAILSQNEVEILLRDLEDNFDEDSDDAFENMILESLVENVEETNENDEGAKPKKPILSQDEIDRLLGPVDDDVEVLLGHEISENESDDRFVDINVLGLYSLNGNALASFLILDMLSDSVDLREVLDTPIRLDTRGMLLCFGHLLQNLVEIMNDVGEVEGVEEKFETSVFSLAVKLLSDEVQYIKDV